MFGFVGPLMLADLPAEMVAQMPADEKRMSFEKLSEFFPAVHFPYLYFTLNMLEVAIYADIEQMDTHMEDFFKNFLWVFTPQVG